MDYWRECIDIAFDEFGISATEEQREEVAGAVEVGHDNYGMAFGHDVASKNFKAHKEGELEELSRKLERERKKIHCKVCNGSGEEVIQGPYHVGVSRCYKCNGQGRHDP